jgi:hypothetical protein
MSHPNYINNNIIVDVIPSRRNLAPRNIVRGYIGLMVNPMKGTQVRRNIIYSTRKDYPPIIEHLLYGTGPEPRLRDADADYNLYWCETDPEWGQRHLKAQQPFGVEAHSLSADPQFVDVARGDFRLKTNSPAWKLGFEAIDISNMGLRRGHPYYHSRTKGN